MSIIEFLKGKKTYLVAIAIAVVPFAIAMGWVTEDVGKFILVILAGGGFAAMRDGIKQGNKKRIKN